jgi:MSHA biogenesis protein MshI
LDGSGDRLASLLRTGWFDGAHIGLMLGPRQREVAIVNRPDVPDADLVEAMRWQVAESLSFPPEEAVLDVLTMDETLPLGRQQVVVAAAPRTQLAGLLAPFTALRRAKVTWVDLIDCAQRNLVAALDATHSLACLSLHDGQLLLTVSRGRELIYTRVFELEAEPRGQGLPIERIGTQIQRAIDTIARRAPGAGPEQMLLGPARTDASALAAIADLTGLPVRRLQIPPGWILDAAVQAQFAAEPECLSLLGALLRAPEPGARGV